MNRCAVLFALLGFQPQIVDAQASIDPIVTIRSAESLLYRRPVVGHPILSMPSVKLRTPFFAGIVVAKNRIITGRIPENVSRGGLVVFFSVPIRMGRDHFFLSHREERARILRVDGRLGLTLLLVKEPDCIPYPELADLTPDETVRWPSILENGFPWNYTIGKFSENLEEDLGRFTGMATTPVFDGSNRRMVGLVVQINGVPKFVPAATIRRFLGDQQLISAR